MKPVPGQASPRANPVGTWVCLGEGSEVARGAAVGTGLSILASLLFDSRRGLQNLIRADVLAILTLYLLTFFEMLFPQPAFNAAVDASQAERGATMLLLGFAGVIVGRHLWHPRKSPFWALRTAPIPQSRILRVFWGCFILGYFYMFVSVGFDPMVFIDSMTRPRFAQPWARGQFGDWNALLSELFLLVTLIPPLAGIVIARRARYSRRQILLIVLATALTLFWGLASGTRSLFASYVGTFLVGYAVGLDRGRQRELAMVATACAAVLVVGATAMLAFRDVGLKRFWTEGTLGRPIDETVFIDADYLIICRLADVFPRQYQYLGLEVPYLGLVRPIPRALWPGKPIGLSTSMEDALGAEGLTLAASFVGEAYVSGGFVAVLIAGTALGVLLGWWGHLASPQNSDLGALIYVSGFSAAVISMRSLLAITTTILPTLACLGVALLLRRRLRSAVRSASLRPSVTSNRQ